MFRLSRVEYVVSVIVLIDDCETKRDEESVTGFILYGKVLLDNMRYL